jgi:chromosomal replication initiation ATPase DnaA
MRTRAIDKRPHSQSGCDNAYESANLSIPDMRDRCRFKIAVPKYDAVAACDGIIDLLAVYFNVSGRQLRSARRTSEGVCRVRQIGMYIAHVMLGLRMNDVGEGFGRDKSTVVHACHTIEDMRDDEDFDHVVASAENLVATAFSLGPEVRGFDA